MFHGGRCWVSDTEHQNYRAGRRATKVIKHVCEDREKRGIEAEKRARQKDRKRERERERERERGQTER